MGGKLVPLHEAIHNFVDDGDTIGLGGFVITRNVVAAVHELIRQRKMGLTICQPLSGFDTDLLVGAGNAARLIISGGSLDAFGRLNRINELCVTGKVGVEENSNLGMVTRLLAGSMGLPFLPTRGLLGSSILESLENEAHAAVEIKSPFTGEPVVLLRALTMKTAVIHVQRADEDGNAQILGPSWDTQVMAGAAERVILTTEEVVDKSELRKTPERTLIPSFKVASVSLVPFGSYPTSCYQYYDYDAEHLKAYAAASASPDRFDQYLRENVLAHDDFEGYLNACCPQSRREVLRANAGRGYQG